MFELNNNFIKEKENYKKRISDLEKNLRDAEGKKGSLLLELEKEKAKWNIEKDNLSSKYSELNDKYARLEKKNESLVRENEKLRNEKNMLRRAGATTTGRYTLMLRDGGNALGSTIIGNLGLGTKNTLNFGQFNKNSLNKNIKDNINIDIKNENLNIDNIENKEDENQKNEENNE